MGIKFPTPWKTLIIKFPPPRDGKGVKYPGYARGGMLKLRFDRYINITNSFSFSLHNLPFFILFCAAELSIILQRLVLLHRSLRFNDRNSTIDCNFGNTWRIFGVKITDKVARTLFHSLLLFCSDKFFPIFLLTNSI